MPSVSLRRDSRNLGSFKSRPRASIVRRPQIREYGRDLEQNALFAEVYAPAVPRASRAIVRDYAFRDAARKRQLHLCFRLSVAELRIAHVAPHW
jgi:hypothetical protein